MSNYEIRLTIYFTMTLSNYELQLIISLRDHYELCDEDIIMTLHINDCNQ